MEPEPKTPYAFDKLNSEYLCRTFSQLGLKTCCLRFFNVYGPKQNIGSDYAAVIPIFIDKALNNEPLKLENSGIQTRDFVFVKDIVNACELAMEKLEGIYNLASEKETSVRELAEIIIKITHSTSELKDAPKRPGDVEKSVGDSSKIKKEGWKPEKDIEQGLKQTIGWFKSRN
jgi:UDP-glucose 4-epimerase